jgi:hypothetical protein
MATPAETIAEAIEDNVRLLVLASGVTLTEYQKSEGEIVTAIAKQAEAAARKHFIDVVGGDVKDALEGDSNDSEHDALVDVAGYFDIEYRSPYDDDEDEDDEPLDEAVARDLGRRAADYARNPKKHRDPRFAWGASEVENDMTDAEWFEAMGESRSES